jgi:hypothetical protein
MASVRLLAGRPLRDAGLRWKRRSAPGCRNEWRVCLTGRSLSESEARRLGASRRSRRSRAVPRRFGSDLDRAADRQRHNEPRLQSRDVLLGKERHRLGSFGCPNGPDDGGIGRAEKQDDVRRIERCRLNPDHDLIRRFGHRRFLKEQFQRPSEVIFERSSSPWRYISQCRVEARRYWPGVMPVPSRNARVKFA